MRRVLLPVAVLACRPPADPPSDRSGPSIPPPFTVTLDPQTPTTFPPPTRLALACEDTPNALRFGCHVTVEPPQPVQVRFSRADGAGPERTHTSSAYSTEHDVPLYFMAPDTAYEVIATAVDWPDHLAATDTVTTTTPPPEVDSWLVVEGTSTMGLIGTELPCDVDAVAVVYDTTTGELVWYEELDPEGELGFWDMIRFTDHHTVLGEVETAIVEVDLAGNDRVRLERDVVYDERLHHDLLAWNDQYWGLYQVVQFGLILDAMLALDAAGNTVARWSPSEHLEIPAGAFGDWMHTNSIAVDADGDLYLSLRTQGTIVKLEGDLLDPGFGDPLWILAGNRSGGLDADIDVDWTRISEPAGFSDQHNVHVRRDGRLMLLDNDHGRALVLSVDPLSKTATVDAEYPTAELRCGPQGTAMETRAGNPVVGCYLGKVREYDLVTSEVLWEAEPECTRIGGPFGTGATRWYPLDGW